MQLKQNSKDSLGNYIEKYDQKMKISLFNKTYMIKVFFIFVLSLSIVSSPRQVNAGFFSDLFDSVASFVGDSSGQEASVYNSQNIPLIQSNSINTDVKDIGFSPAYETPDDALSTDSLLQGTDSGTNSYNISTDKITTYTVLEGDTLASIAKKFNISTNTIIYANTNIKNNSLKVGQTIIILPVDGVSYIVKKGDTISSIAKNYKADANDILEYNNITASSLKIGETIILPGGVKINNTPTTPTSKPANVAQNTNTNNASVASKSVVSANPNTISSVGITDGYIWPFPKGVGRVSQRLHDDNAYDMAAPYGTPIYAIQSGTVLIADSSGYNGGYGLYVVLDFKDGAQAILGHMSKVAVTSGQKVRKGDIVGYVGSTGRSTGNHIHIGYRGGKPNPYRNLPLNSNGL
jgi:murein DD-endopeptidase MepM/ murein hydrolase activator NlpD